MKIRVKLFGVLYELVGSFKLELNVAGKLTIKDLIDLLSQTFNPKISEVLLNGDGLRSDYIIMVNGKAIEWINGLNTSLNDGDEVVMLPSAEGG